MNRCFTFRRVWGSIFVFFHILLVIDLHCACLCFKSIPFFLQWTQRKSNLSWGLCQPPLPLSVFFQCLLLLSLCCLETGVQEAPQENALVDTREYIVFCLHAHISKWKYNETYAKRSSPSLEWNSIASTNESQKTLSNLVMSYSSPFYIAIYEPWESTIITQQHLICNTNKLSNISHIPAEVVNLCQTAPSNAPIDWSEATQLWNQGVTSNQQPFHYFISVLNLDGTSKSQYSTRIVIHSVTEIGHSTNWHAMKDERICVLMFTENSQFDMGENRGMGSRVRADSSYLKWR
jgi:hypothetical protein